jgi:hypothetical protein
MEVRKVFAIALLLIALMISGCAGMSNYQPTGGPNMMGCEGDVPSPYPPYCHPVHD